MLSDVDKREAMRSIMPHLFVPLKHSANTLFSFCIQKIPTIQMDLTEKVKHTEGRLPPPTLPPTIIGPDWSDESSVGVCGSFSKCFSNPYLTSLSILHIQSSPTSSSVCLHPPSVLFSQLVLYSIKTTSRRENTAMSVCFVP